MAEYKTVRIRLVRSPIGYNKRQKLIVRTLGLTKMNAARDVLWTPQMQGMVAKVPHLVAVEDIAE